MDVRVQVDFEDSGKHGWAEIFYLAGQGENLQITLDKVMDSTAPAGNLPGGYIYTRLRVLAANYYLTGVTVSNVAAKRDSLADALSFADGQGKYPVASENEQAWDALNIRCEATAFHRRIFQMRGLPRGCISGNGYYTPTAQFRQNVVRFIATLEKGLPMAIQTQTRGARVFPSAIAISASGSGLILTFAGGVPVGMTADSYIFLKGFFGSNNTNGLWRINRVVGNDIWTYARRTPIYGAPAATGSVQLIAYAYVPITGAKPTKGAKKNTGRPTGLPVGRRRVRST